MKTLYLFIALGLTTIHGACAEQVPPHADTNSVAFREPFTLKLHVDKEHYYEQTLPKIPYVYQDDVYLVKGDAFGIDLRITNGVVGGVSYQPDTNKAAINLRFTQEIQDNGNAMMLLVLENHTKHKLFVDALMAVPNKEHPQKTSILPIEPGLIGFESWPHPIVQLVLRNIRFTVEPDAEPKGPATGSHPNPLRTNATSSPTGSRR